VQLCCFFLFFLLISFFFLLSHKSRETPRAGDGELNSGGVLGSESRWRQRKHELEVIVGGAADWEHGSEKARLWRSGDVMNWKWHGKVGLCGGLGRA
jgi:hypothetical protein